MNSGGMMKRSLAILAVLMITVIMPGIAFSQQVQYVIGDDGRSANTIGSAAFYNTGGGVRAAGMGGAFAGISEGEMAYSWNPAGMMFADKRSIGLQFISKNDKANGPEILRYYRSTGRLHYVSIQDVEVKSKLSNVDFSGFTLPFNFFDRAWAVGGGFRTVIDMSSEFESAGLAGSRNIFTATGGVDAFSVALAGKITDNIGIGVTANNYIRNYQSNLFYGNAMSYIPSTGTAPDTVDTWISQNIHYSGFNADLGVMAQYSMFKGGFTIHTPLDLKAKNKYTYISMIPPSPSGTVSRFTYTTSIPLAFTIGLSAKPVEKLLVAFDYDSHPMSSAEIKFDAESNAIGDTTFDAGWEDLSQFRIGAEYMLKTEFAEIPVRIGLRNNPSISKELLTETLQEDSTVARTYGDQINSMIITLGTGLKFEKSWIDIAYQFGSHSYNTTINYGTEQVIETKHDYSRLYIGAGMNF
jgi:long-subunit fatty acid transport protein